MFAEAIVLAKLAKFRAKYGWVPKRHSIREVEAATAYIESLYATNAKGETFIDTSKWTQNLSRFVENERALCAMDCEYFLTRYYKIAANNDIIRFSLRAGQRVFYRVIQELEAAGKPIEIQCLKARQQGISTLIEGIMTHRALFVPGAKCSIGSANDQKTYVMMTMMYTALDHIPQWLSPTRTKDKRSGAPMLEFSHVGTSIVIQSGSMKGGIGQGTTPTAVHLSEVCDFTNPLIQIEEGLFKAVHSDPSIFMVLESTGNGNTGWWADQWRNNKENYHLGLSRFMPVFLPWFMTPELFPTPQWRKDHPITVESWHPAEETRAMTAKCEAYVRNTEILTKILGKGWKLPIEQQWFWQWNFMDCRRRGTEKSWLRQMPCDDFDALVGDHDSVFDRDAIGKIDATRNRTPDVYAIIGEGIAQKHEPPPFDISDGKRLLADWTTPKDERYEWCFLPIRDNDTEKSTFNPNKKLVIYEYPEKNADYSIGADTGTGVGGDRSPIIVTRAGSEAWPDVQVAEFCCDDITNTEIYAYVAAIAALYGQFMEEGKHPKIIIEQKRKYGDTCQHQLLLMGMRRHHEFISYDKKTLRPKAREGSRLGWFTNEWSRPMLLGCFKYAVENGWFVVNSRWLMNEIEEFEQRLTTAGKTRMDHQSGKHDDRIFGAAMSYFTNHHLDSMMAREKLKFNAPTDEGYVVNYKPFMHTMTDELAGEFFRNE